MSDSGDRAEARPVQEDMAFQQRSWRIERAAWVVMSIIAVAALLGLFAEGPFSTVTNAASDRSLSVRHERFARKTATTRFVLLIQAPQTPASVTLSASFLETYDLEWVHPQPIRAVAGASGLELMFGVTPQAAGIITLNARPKRFGWSTFQVATAPAGQVEIRQLIYP
jgi:hypothetical protein